MTAEQLHDALTLLPADLVAETDRLRCPRAKTIPWKRLWAMAACFALVLGCGWYSLLLFGPKGGSTEQATMAAPEMMQESSAIAEPAAPAPAEAPAEEERTMEDTVTGTGATSHLHLEIDHTHHPAEATETGETNGWCGNMMVTVTLDTMTYTLSGTYAVTLTDILYHLDYSPDALCRCAAEFTVDTEMGQGYQVNLTEYFVRHDAGQASLTEEQAAALRAIIETLE